MSERVLIHRYAHYFYRSPEDGNNDTVIRQNLEKLLDADGEGGGLGVAVYCSRFESIKKRDWKRLINFIKKNAREIKILSYVPAKQDRIREAQEIRLMLKEKRKRRSKRFDNYKISGRGKKAIPCVYEGRHYLSREECMFRENITKRALYTYLKEHEEDQIAEQRRCELAARERNEESMEAGE